VNFLLFSPGPLTMSSVWSFLTKFNESSTVDVGSDFQLSQDNTVIVDTFRNVQGLPPINLKFNCTYGKGVRYYF
jgi:hypothetical protein